MNPFKNYRHTTFGIILAGVVLLIVLRIEDVVKLLQLASNAVFPFILGLCIAFVLDILVQRFEKIYFPKVTEGWKYKTRPIATVMLAFLSILVVISLVVTLVGPQLLQSIAIIAKVAPKLFNEAMTKLDALFVENNINQSDINDILKQLEGSFQTGANAFVTVMKNVFGTVVDTVIGFLFAIYLLLEKVQLKRQINRVSQAFLSEETRKQWSHIYGIANDAFSHFFIGQVLDAIVLGAIITIGLFLTGVSYPLTIGCVIGLTAVIPMVGAYIGAFMGSIILLSVSGTETLMFLIVLVIAQQIEGNFIYPKLVGGSVGLPGIWVFVAVAIGGSLGGVPGMLIGVPLAATLYKLLQEKVHNNLMRKAQVKEKQ